ncbi:hypothetical protein [Rickettsia endosymbiont of Orchestes rusci]
MTHGTFLEPYNNAATERSAAIQLNIVILNLFQDILKKMLKQVQHDKD